MSIVDFIAVVSFGITCFFAGYTFGKDISKFFNLTTPHTNWKFQILYFSTDLLNRCFNARTCILISSITFLTSSSLFPVGSSSPQLSSNGLPINGHPTLQPIEIAISGIGISSISLLYCPSDSISLPYSSFMIRTAS